MKSYTNQAITNILVGVIIVVILGIAGYFTLTKTKPSQKPIIPITQQQTTEPTTTALFQPKTATETTKDIDTSNWKTYKNEKYGFEFKYPRDYQIDIENSKITINPPDNIKKKVENSLSIIISDYNSIESSLYNLEKSLYKFYKKPILVFTDVPGGTFYTVSKINNRLVKIIYGFYYVVENNNVHVPDQEQAYETANIDIVKNITTDEEKRCGDLISKIGLQELQSVRLGSGDAGFTYSVDYVFLQNYYIGLGNDWGASAYTGEDFNSINTNYKKILNTILKSFKIDNQNSILKVDGCEHNDLKIFVPKYGYG